jgi:hypothetical protein
MGVESNVVTIAGSSWRSSPSIFPTSGWSSLSCRRREEESMKDKHEVGPDVDHEAEEIRDRQGGG